MSDANPSLLNAQLLIIILILETLVFTLFSYVIIAVVEFYRNLGFEPDPEGIKGMFWSPRF